MLEGKAGKVYRRLAARFDEKFLAHFSDCYLGNAQLEGNILLHFSGGDELEDLQFPRSKPMFIDANSAFKGALATRTAIVIIGIEAAAGSEVC